MSKTSRNFVVAYILLVGLPILGLVGVLKSGRSLAAPISIDGVWQLRADPAQLAALPCGKTFADGAPTLSISQSGKNFSWNLGSLNPSSGSSSDASGVIDGTTLHASLLPAGSASDGGCGQSRALTLVATVNPKADPRSLAGTLSLNDCASCAPVAFNAVRLAPPAKKGSR
jgi:hypothetical protein